MTTHTRTLRACLATVALLIALPGLASVAVAADVPTSYTVEHPDDLFGSDARIDVTNLRLTANVNWTLPPQNVRSSQTVEPLLTPAPGDLTASADYELSAACCPSATKSGTLTVTGKTVIDCKEIPYSDSGWTVTLILCGNLEAKPSRQGGPGTVRPTSLTWRDGNWNGQAIRVTANTDATTGDAVAVSVPTYYTLTVTIRVEGYGLSKSSPTITLDTVQGQPTLTERFDILTDTPASPPPPPPPPPASPPPAPPAAPAPAPAPAPSPAPAPAAQPPAPSPSPTPAPAPPAAPPTTPPPTAKSPGAELGLAITAGFLVALLRRRSRTY